MLNYIEFAEKKEKVLAQLEEFQTQTQNVIEVIENPEVVAALRQDKLQNLSFLKENYNVRPTTNFFINPPPYMFANVSCIQITDNQILSLYDYGQLQFNCGNYGGAADMLYHFRVLVSFVIDDPSTISVTFTK